MESITKVFSDIVKPYIDKTASTSGDPKTVSYADIVSIKDGAGVLAKDVSIKIEPVQAGSGTPSPSNVRAISGRSEVTVTRCGKNLLNPNVTTASTEVFKVFGGASNTNYPDGTLTLNAGTYTVSVSGVMERIVIRDNNADIVSDSSNTSFLTFTISRRTAIKVGLQKSGNIWNTLTYQLELGSAATAYEAPNINDYIIDLGGTIYGGTLDVTTGVLTVDKGIIDLGDLTYVYNSTYSRFSSSITGMKIAPDTRMLKMFCSCYECISDGRALSDVPNNSIYNAGLTDGVYIHDSRYTVPSDLKTALTGQKLVYPLATPQVIQLTPTQIRMLAGVNTIYADTGDTQVEYFNASVGNLGEVIGDVQEDTKGLTDNQFENGCVNLFENKASSATESGFTLIVNSDKSVTANGSGSIYFVLNTYTQDEFNAKFAGKRLKISGTPESLLSNNIRLYAEIVSSGTALIDEYNSPIYTMPTVSDSVRFYLKINGSVTNAVFKPMITVADMPNSDYAHYVPYCKSNKELTDDLATNEYVDTNISWASDASTNFTLTNATKHFRVNKFLHHCIVDVDGVVLKNGWSASEAYPLLATGNNSYNPPYSKRTLVPYFQNGSTWYKMYSAKSNSHDGVSLTALESIPSGTSLSFTLEWTY